MYKIYSLLILSSVLISCGGGGGGGGGSADGGNTESALVGTWKTQECAAVENDIWLKGIFQFTSDGAILVGNEQFTDSNCISKVATQEPLSIQTITFEDSGNILLQEGIDGAGLKITVSSVSNTLSRNAFYTINNGVLCFSEAFTLEALGIGITEAGLSTIDFSSCLEKP